MIIELTHDLTKFRNISVKSYFIDCTSIEDQQSVPNSPVPMQETTSVKAPQTQVPPADVPPTKAFTAEAPPKKNTFSLFNSS